MRADPQLTPEELAISARLSAAHQKHAETLVMAGFSSIAGVRAASAEQMVQAGIPPEDAAAVCKALQVNSNT